MTMTTYSGNITVSNLSKSNFLIDSKMMGSSSLLPSVCSVAGTLNMSLNALEFFSK